PLPAIPASPPIPVFGCNLAWSKASKILSTEDVDNSVEKNWARGNFPCIRLASLSCLIFRQSGNQLKTRQYFPTCRQITETIGRIVTHLSRPRYKWTSQARPSVSGRFFASPHPKCRASSSPDAGPHRRRSIARSEERRVGKECSTRGGACHQWEDARTHI